MTTRDTYTAQTWENLPSEKTPVSAERLAHIEQGIKDAADKRALKEIYDDDAISLGRKAGTTVGYFSTAEGSGTIATSLCSHAEGSSTTAGGTNSHAEGDGTIAGGYCSHAEGYKTIAGDGSSHAEGSFTQAVKENAHAEGYYTQANADSAHAEGYYTNVVSSYGHAEGYRTTAAGIQSHAEGDSTVAQGNSSHVEGYNTKAYGSFCHAEGYSAVSGFVQSPQSSYSSHAEGYQTLAAGSYCHAEGNGSVAGENPGTSASHAEGNQTKAIGNHSHAEGDHTIANGPAQHVSGKYNIPDGGQYASMVGGGTSDTDRKNIHTLDWTGNGWFAGDVRNGAGVSLNSLKSDIDNMAAIAAGGAIAKVFDTKAELDAWLAVEGNTETLTVGQNIYIKATETPDYWWDGAGLQVLETDKVEIESMTYDETMSILNATAEEVK